MPCGAIATNVICGSVNADILRSTVSAAGIDPGEGEVIVTADNTSDIDARISTLSVAVSAGGGSAKAASIGISVARNFIGFDELHDYTSDAFATDEFEYTSNQSPAVITDGERVRLTEDFDPNVDREGEIYQYSGADLSDFVFTPLTVTEANGWTRIENQQTLETGDIVRLAEDYANGGKGGALYEYLGADGIVDIGREDYSVVGRWSPVAEPATIPLEVQAFIQDSEITAAGKVDVLAASSATIDALVEAAAVGVSASAKKAGGLSGAGVFTENKIATAVRGFIEYSDSYAGDAEVVVNGGNLTLSATDASDITADARAASLAAAFSGQKAGALSIGLSLAFNTVDNEVAAFIDNAALVDVDGGITISASETGSIDVTAAAASVAVAAAGGTSAGLSGGGAVATNVILTDVNAYVEDSTLGSSGTANTLTFVDIDAVNNSDIDATVAAAAIGAGLSGKTGIGAAIGFSLVRNFVGWDPAGTDFDPTQAGNYTTADSLQTLTTGDQVQVVGGARNGEVYEYIGDDVTRFDHVAGSGATATDGDLVYVPSTGAIYEYDGSGSTTVNLADAVYEDVAETGDWIYRGAWDIDFSDRLNWEQVLDIDPANAADVQAYLSNSSVTTSGALTVDAHASETIDSIALSGAAALGGGGTTGVAVSVAGVLTENRFQRHRCRQHQFDFARRGHDQGRRRRGVDCGRFRRHHGCRRIHRARGGAERGQQRGRGLYRRCSRGYRGERRYRCRRACVTWPGRCSSPRQQ